MEQIELDIKAAFSTISASTPMQNIRFKSGIVEFDLDIPLFLSTQYGDYPP
jgi:hypothetical protein